MKAAILPLVALVAACSSEPAVVNVVGAANDNTSPQRSLVYDGADMLSDAAEERLRRRILDLEAATGDELFVWTTPSLEGQTIEAYSLNLGRSLGIGKPELDNGILFVVARDERRLRIEVGSGLEGLLTDVAAGRIIRRTIEPAFRDGEFERGFEEGADVIADLLEEDPVRPRYRSEVRRRAAQ
ncbi:TPM domain-containing protein [Sphingomicrobium marinum]|uniref:TPM domain-containing protein n=1 Tax=Sphingomicrobium marinum TaxID=1227950 RepID=UPI002240AA60|nr:TPM domain-containing protein [Sphingomicrobium marinum]